MKYLITGGAGFIGSHLAEKLITGGDEVHVLDDLSTGSVENLDAIRDNPKFHLVIGSVTDISTVAELVDRAEVTFHLAAAVGVRLIVERPVHTIVTNIHGTETVLECADKKKKKVVITSTSEIYGKNEQVPFSEEMDMVFGATTKSRWSYACSKAIDEFLALSYFRERKLPVVVVRLFNTVGPRQVGHYGMVVPRFIEQALSGRPITIYNDGRQTRCFLHVADAVEALVKLADAEAAIGEVFNVGSDEEISILELAKKVKRITDSESEIQFVPYGKAYEKGFEDMKRRVPDTRKVRRVIGFSPTKTIDQVLAEVTEYFRKRARDRDSKGGGHD